MRSLLLVAALLVAACGSGGDPEAEADATITDAGPAPGGNEPGPRSTTVASSVPPSTPGPVPDGGPARWLPPSDAVSEVQGGPRILVSDGVTAQRVQASAVVALDGLPNPIGTVVGDGFGSVVVERVEVDDDGSERSVSLLWQAGTEWRELPVEDHASVVVQDLVTLDGRPAVVYTLFRDPGAGEISGTVRLQALDSDEWIELAVAAAPEYYVSRVSAAADLVVLSAYSDLTEDVSFVGYDGAEVERWSPTDELAYNRPPLVTDAVLSPDGSELAYLEGPDSAGPIDSADAGLVGDWEVVIVDEAGEQFRLVVAEQDMQAVHLDFDGRWLLLSGADADGWVEPLLIDSEATDLPAYLVGGHPGHATLDVAAAAAAPGSATVPSR